MKDVFQYFTNQNETGAVLLADFTKAVDALDMKFLNLCLEKFNFGLSFRSWITVLYTDITSCALVNGWISEPFYVKRGARQGCPLSSGVLGIPRRGGGGASDLDEQGGCVQCSGVDPFFGWGRGNVNNFKKNRRASRAKVLISNFFACSAPQKLIWCIFSGIFMLNLMVL